MTHHTFIETLTKLFKKAANPTIAQQQAAYMKNKFKFFGIKKPDRSLIEAPLIKHFKIDDEKLLIKTVRTLWKQEEREFQYTALQLMSKHKKILPAEFLTVVEELIRTKSWWDTVDTLSSDIVGPIVIKFPEVAITIDRWIEDGDFWIRRSAIIHQLMAKEKTNLDRLFKYCEKTMHEKEFFIRKAIGWALRQHSKTDPKAIKEFVEKYRTKLSGLSLREARKYLG